MAFGSRLSAFGKNIMCETAEGRQPNADGPKRHSN
jgi:hypothetical protein